MDYHSVITADYDLVPQWHVYVLPMSRRLHIILQSTLPYDSHAKQKNFGITYITSTLITWMYTNWLKCESDLIVIWTRGYIFRWDVPFKLGSQSEQWRDRSDFNKIDIHQFYVVAIMFVSDVWAMLANAAWNMCHYEIDTNTSLFDVGIQAERIAQHIGYTASKIL